MTYRFKGEASDGTVYYLTIKSDLIKLVNQQNRPLALATLCADAAACRFSLEDARDRNLTYDIKQNEERRVKLFLAVLKFYTNLTWSEFVSQGVEK